jgi:hypothetical protein
LTTDYYFRCRLILKTLNVAAVSSRRLHIDLPTGGFGNVSLAEFDPRCWKPKSSHGQYKSSLKYLLPEADPTQLVRMNPRSQIKSPSTCLSLGTYLGWSPPDYRAFDIVVRRTSLKRMSKLRQDQKAVHTLPALKPSMPGAFPIKCCIFCYSNSLPFKCGETIYPRDWVE